MLWQRRTNLKSKKNRIRCGATAVEMALIAPVFFTMLMGMTETALVETAQQLLENAAYNTSRLAKTGYTATGQSQLQTVSQIMTQELQSFGTFIDTTKVTMTSTAYNSFGGIGVGGASGLGAAQQIVVYTVTYPWKLFTPLVSGLIGSEGVVTLTSRIVVRDEPY